MKTYLLKNTLPNDLQNGGDLRFLNLCAFIERVFFVERKARSASGGRLKADAPWACTQLGRLADITLHFPHCRNATWIAGDYESFAALKALCVQPVVYDGCDALSLYFKRRFDHLPWRQWIRKLNALRLFLAWLIRERSIAKYCSGIVVPAAEDACAFKRWGNPNVVLITNGTRWIDNPAIERGTNARAMLFHGAFSWPVNVATATYLVQELFPVVKARMEDAELRIAGNPAPTHLEESGQFPGVSMEGYVDDIREWLSQCAVYVMPMLQGGGVKNKLLEAMAAGLPIVTNTMGAEAMDQEAKQCFLVADGTNAIATAVIELIENPGDADALGKRARQYALANFKWEDLALEYQKFISKISEESS